MKRRVGICDTCGNQVSVTVHGIVVSHRGNFNSGREGCPGSGKPERQTFANPEETR